MIKFADIGKPLDLDGMAFWSHKNAYQAAMIHIKLGERNVEWKADLEALKRYMSVFVSRFELYGMCEDKMTQCDTNTDNMQQVI
jgi:hypothetical protein